MAGNGIVNNSSMLVLFYSLFNSPWGLPRVEPTENINCIPVGPCILYITLSQELHMSIYISIS